MAEDYATYGVLRVNGLDIAGLTNMKDDDKASFPTIYDSDTQTDYGTPVAGLNKMEGSVSADANLKFDAFDELAESYTVMRALFETGTLLDLQRQYTNGATEECTARIESISSEFSLTREDVATFSVTFKKQSAWQTA